MSAALDRLKRFMRVPRTLAQLKLLTGISEKTLLRLIANTRHAVSVINGPCDRPAKGYCLQ